VDSSFDVDKSLTAIDRTMEKLDKACDELEKVLGDKEKAMIAESEAYHSLGVFEKAEIRRNTRPLGL
jgi:hypothetical protein